MYCPRCTSPIKTDEPDCLCEVCGWFGDASETLAEQTPDVFSPGRSAIATMELYRDICRKELIAEQLYDAGDATEEDLHKIAAQRRESVNLMVTMFCRLRAHYETCPIETLTAEPSGTVQWPENWIHYHRECGCDENCDVLIGQCVCGQWHTGEEQWVKDELKLHRAVIDQSEVAE
jgi:hypothetical protein